MTPRFSDYLDTETMPLPSNTLSESEKVTVATEPPYVSASAVLSASQLTSSDRHVARRLK